MPIFEGSDVGEPRWPDILAAHETELEIAATERPSPPAVEAYRAVEAQAVSLLAWPTAILLAFAAGCVLAWCVS